MNKQELVPELNVLLADAQVLYMKLRGYHWTVTGPKFFMLHEKFEELYDQMADRVDEIAERIAALGGRPIWTFAETIEQARLAEDGKTRDPNDMVRNVIGDFEAFNASLRGSAERAGGASDPATANLLEEMADAQEKDAWMLRAWLEA